MHWSDALVKDLTGDHRVSTGISPSGPIHVGNMREILTGDMIHRALLKKGLRSDFIYLCDDMDPLRKVYPFLPQGYQEHVGKPLFKIPSPDGNGTYSEHFLAPFIHVMEVLEVGARVIRTSGLYGSGVFEDAIDRVINAREKVRAILEEVSGREIEGDWYPYSPICSACGKINTTRVTGYQRPYVYYTCTCGHSGRADIRRAEGKMPWRVEWPAKWYALGVTIEPFGKDHGAAGGSYDTGKRIAEEVFGIRAPVPLMYERILLKGKGAMHSSTGLAIAASEMIEFAPPQILRFLIAKTNPARHIDFDPGMGLLSLIDEFEKYENAYYGLDTLKDEDFRTIYELSYIRNLPHGPDGIRFRHLVTLVQIYQDRDSLMAALRRSGYREGSGDGGLEFEISVVKNWLSKYAPEQVKFTLLPRGEKVVVDGDEKAVLEAFLRAIPDIRWDAEEIHNRVHGIAKGLGIAPSKAFASFYRILIGKDTGPRLGYFLSNLSREFVEERIRACIT